MAKQRTDNKGRILQKGEGQRADGRYYYAFRDSTGKQHFIYNTSLLGLREEKAQIERDKLNGISWSDMSIGDGFKQLCTTRTDWARHTAENNMRIYKHHIEARLGSRKLRELTYSDMVCFYNELAAAGKAKGTINITKSILSMICGIAVKNGIVSQNVAKLAFADGTRACRKREKRKALTVEQQKHFMCAIAGTKAENLCLFLLFSGLRFGECMGLTWKDVDFEKGTITVNKQLCKSDDGSLYINATKTAAGKRQVPLTSIARQALLQQREQAKTQQAAFTRLIDGVGGFVFPYIDNPTMNWRIADAIKKYNAKHGTSIPRVSPHILRHTFCSRLCELEPNAKTVATIMGHSDIAVTLNVYAEIDVGRTTEATSKLDAVFAG